MPFPLGLDFGTTNSAIAVAHEDGTVESVEIDNRPTFRSVLHFLCLEDEDLRRALRAGEPPALITAGGHAIEAYSANRGEGRLVQSLKSFLASRTFSETRICHQRYRLEDLLAELLSRLFDAARPRIGDPGKRIVVGRPVHFVGETELPWDGPADATAGARAEQRIRTALERLGFEEIEFLHEPVAAAYHFARHLDRRARLLVADFGGGTSDFTILEMRPGETARPLATDGIGVAGDAFDARIVREVIAPALGRDRLFLGPDSALLQRSLKRAYLERATGERELRVDGPLLDLLAGILPLDFAALAAAAARLDAIAEPLPGARGKHGLRLIKKTWNDRPLEYRIGHGPRAEDSIEIATALSTVDPTIRIVLYGERPAADRRHEGAEAAKRRLPSVEDLLRWAEREAPAIAEEIRGVALPVPAWIYGKLGSWHDLSFIRDSRAIELLKRLEAVADPSLGAPIEALRGIVEEERGFELYRSVSAVKEALSHAESAELAFACPPLDIRVTVARRDFEAWITPELGGIEACVDRVVAKAGLELADVDVVFLTGGSSFVPAVRRIFESRFGEAKLRGGDEFVSIARGLALHARDRFGSS